MSRIVTKIPEKAQLLPAKKQPLRVVAYCRVSTTHEEQQEAWKPQLTKPL